MVRMGMVMKLTDKASHFIPFAHFINSIKHEHSCNILYFQDMYDAFKQKICVPNFPVENSPGFRAAEQAVRSIIKLTR